MGIGEILKELRLDARLSADEVAERLGKKGAHRKQYIYDIEAGRIKKVGLEKLMKFGAIFKVPVSYFERRIGAQNICVDMIKPEFSYKEDANFKLKYEEVLAENSQLKSEIIVLLRELKSLT